ncbi:MAG TPA: aldose epimerase [Rhodanobacteraceae bacterium]|nr:aldose epimerase [Rhodanobacteraceae bacterium]
MSTFAVESGARFGHGLAVLCGPDGLRAEISLRGATLLGLTREVHGRPWDFAWGYASARALEAHVDSRFAVMVPFGGRVRNSAYTFAGRRHRLAAPAGGVDGVAMHGLARDLDFELAGLAADATSARARLTATVGAAPGYPFTIGLALQFELVRDGLRLTASMRNLGNAAAPCFFGWHAYVRPSAATVDEWVLCVPARGFIAMDSNLIALDGPAAYRPLASRPELDFSRPRKIGPTVLDVAYRDGVPAADGRLRCTASDPATGVSVRVWQQGGVVRVFTGDTLPEGARSAIALEPMEAMADAFNRPDCQERICLDAGACRTFQCGIELDVAACRDGAA